MTDDLMTKMQRYVSTLREKAAYYTKPPETVQTAYDMSGAYYTAAEGLARILKEEVSPEARGRLTFVECLDCSSVGAPHVLCDGCRHNQKVIAELHCQWESAKRNSPTSAVYEKAAQVCREMVVGGRAWSHDQQIASDALLAAAKNISALTEDA